mmetsp:Transcript_3192/g.7659  ORF Transcript_3192/g.7659 Transcript_3192/m.7659 type:complete len:207 (-) Transcript_3192:247-867(-)
MRCCTVTWGTWLSISCTCSTLWTWRVSSLAPGTLRATPLAHSRQPGWRPLPQPTRPSWPPCRTSGRCSRVPRPSVSAWMARCSVLSACSLVRAASRRCKASFRCEVGMLPCTWASTSCAGAVVLVAPLGTSPTWPDSSEAFATSSLSCPHSAAAQCRRSLALPGDRPVVGKRLSAWPSSLLTTARRCRRCRAPPRQSSSWARPPGS